MSLACSIRLARVCLGSAATRSASASRTGLRGKYELSACPWTPTLEDDDEDAKEGATPSDAHHNSRQHSQRIPLKVIAPQNEHRNQVQCRVHR
jgi:hypothetical protein